MLLINGSVYRFLKILLIPVAVIVFLKVTPVHAEYHRFNSLEKELQALTTAHGDILRLETIGTSIGGRAIYAVTLGTGAVENKPALAVIAGVEGADIAASELALRFIQTVASDYARIDSINSLLQENTIYVLPRVNPDAAEFFFESPSYARKYNLRDMDLDTDGSTGEDGFNDLNDDGFISLMRVEDPTGGWVADTEFPQILRKADAAAGENGTYLLFTEGVDDDKDGDYNEDPPGGVNFNQNFTFQYNYFRDGSGPHQVSEPNSRAVADFLYEHKNVAAIFTFSPNDNLLHPWKAKPGSSEGSEPVSTVLPEDEEYFNRLADQFRTLTSLDNSPDPKRGNGSFSEWGYYHFGRWSVSAPAWWPPRTDSEQDTTGKAAKQSERDLTKYSTDFQEQVHLLRWLNATGQDAQIIPWTQVEHPDFPGKKVEVGGFAPYADINPPADSLESLAGSITPYFITLTQSLPRVRLENIRVEALENSVYRISATIVNSGLLPTSTELGTRIQWVPKIRVELDLTEDQQLASGRPLHIINKLERSSGGRELRWLVVGNRNSSVRITAGSPLVGLTSSTITLR